MSFRSRLILILLAWIIAGSGWRSSPATADEPAQAYFVHRIWTGQGAPIDDAVLVVRDGSVIAVGSRAEVDIPSDAVRHQWPGRVLIPGLVVAETSLGATSGDDSYAVTPQVRAVDGFDFYGDYSGLLAGGVTTIQISPGRQRLMPGQGAVVKLGGANSDERTLVAEESLRVILTDASRNPPRIYEPPVGAVSIERPLEPTRPQLSSSLAGAVAGLRSLVRSAQTAPQDQLDDDPRLEVIASYCGQKRRLRVTASQGAEIQAALALGAEFALPLVLVDPQQLEPFLERLPSANLAGIVLSCEVRPGRVGEPPLPNRRRPEQPRPWESARALTDLGLGDLIAVHPANDDDLESLLFLAGLFTRSGNSPEHVLRMITSNPANILGVAERVGSLAAGRDADFVVLSADPFRTDTRVMATYVDGEMMYDLKKSQRSTIVQAGAVYRGGALLRPGSVVVDGAKIRDVGQTISASPHAEIRSFPSTAVIVPGMVDLATGLGLGEAPSGNTPLQTKFGDRLIGHDPAIDVARQGGVTTVLLTASGSPSPMTAFKLGRTPAVLGDPIGIRFSVGSNVVDAVVGLRRALLLGKAYAESWTKYEQDFKEYEVKLKQYQTELAAFEAAKAAAEARANAQQPSGEANTTGEGQADAPSQNNPTPPNQPAPSGTEPPSGAQDRPPAPVRPETPAADAASGADSQAKEPVKPDEPRKPNVNPGFEPYRPLFAGNAAAFVEVNGVRAIDAAVDLFRGEFQVRTVLVGDDHFDRLAEKLAEHQVGVAVGPILLRQRDNFTVNLPQVMANHQIPFGFQSTARTGVRDLPLAVQYSVHHGLGPLDALKALTAAPAKMLALDNRVGDLAPGMDADLVVWSGPPFELSSEVLAVMVDGEWVFEKGTNP